MLKTFSLSLLRLSVSDNSAGMRSTPTFLKRKIMNTTIEKATELAIAIIKVFEDCKLTAYKCPAGVWTIGWGETQGVKKGMKWTQETANERLCAHLKVFMSGVLKSCPGLQNSPERLGACVSLAYNIGLSAFERSSVCRNTNNEAWIAAANSFPLWNKAGGKVLNGLVRRRAAEKKLYEAGDL